VVIRFTVMESLAFRIFHTKAQSVRQDAKLIIATLREF
jgi:hypothetical protein